MHKAILITLIITNATLTMGFCIWDCDAQKQSSESQATNPVTLNGDHNILNYVDKVRQAPDDHMTDIKIGVFTMAAIMVLGVTGFVFWWLCKRMSQMDHQRIQRRAMSMIRRRGGN